MTSGAILAAYLKALAQLPGPRMLGVVVLALLLALAVTAPLLLVVLPLAALVDVIPVPAFLQSDAGGSWLGWSSWLFWTYVMSPLAVAIVSLLLDRIVEAVEARHYPGLPEIRRRNLGEQIGYALRFFGLMLGISALAALVAWLTPVPGPLVFTAASAYLIAREHYETVALRRMPATEAKRAVAQHTGALWLAALPVALALNVPLVNLVAPILGVAAFTHLFHGPRRSRS